MGHWQTLVVQHVLYVFIDERTTLCSYTCFFIVCLGQDVAFPCVLSRQGYPTVGWLSDIQISKMWFFVHLKGTKAVPDMVETMVGTLSRKRGTDEAFDTRSIWCKMILSNLDAPPRTDTIRVCRMPEAAPFDSQALANEYIFNLWYPSREKSSKFLLANGRCLLKWYAISDRDSG